jgi:hypothetical protein
MKTERKEVNRPDWFVATLLVEAVDCAVVVIIFDVVEGNNDVVMEVNNDVVVEGNNDVVVDVLHVVAVVMVGDGGVGVVKNAVVVILDVNRPVFVVDGVINVMVVALELLGVV